MTLFALDHNYPEPIIGEAAPTLGDIGIELVPLQKIDARLPDFDDDWRLLLALHHHSRPWDGMITNDTGMLDLERELTVLEYTRLTLVAPTRVGHDPVRATGLVLAHIVNIGAQPARPRVARALQQTCSESRTGAPTRVSPRSDHLSHTRTHDHAAIRPAVPDPDRDQA